MQLEVWIGTLDCVVDDAVTSDSGSMPVSLLD